MKQNNFILKMYNGGVPLDKISRAFKKPINEIIEIIYDLKIKKRL